MAAAVMPVFREIHIFTGIALESSLNSDKKLSSDFITNLGCQAKALQMKIQLEHKHFHKFIVAIFM